MEKLADLPALDAELTPRYRAVWDRLERPETQPRRMRRLVVRPYAEFEEKIRRAETRFVEETIASFYAGDIYLLKEAFSREEMERPRRLLHEHGRRTPSTFHKMVQNCPNFHRIIDGEVNRAGLYSFEATKHSYYFYLWNEEEFGLWPSVLRRWRPIKLLGGRLPNEFERNTPLDGIVERLQIAHYPSGAGALELHSDPYLYARIIFSGIMTKRGADFDSGGVYFLDSENRKVDVEERLDLGDLYLSYPTLLHGIDPIDPGRRVDWTDIRGRWWMGIFTNASDHVQNRHTGYGVRDVQVRSESST